MKALFYFLSKFYLLTAFLFLLTIQSKAAIYTVTTVNNSGAGSLTAAIASANATSAADTIQFAIPGPLPAVGYYNIDYSSPWASHPTIDAAGGTLLIDGFSQSGASGCNLKIRVNGNGPWGTGLALNGTSGVVIRGISFTNIYVNINGGSNNRVYGCYFNIAPDGSLIASGGNQSLLLQAGTTGNIIGGTTCSLRNVFGGSTVVAISVTGSDNNTIVGNYVGTTIAGTALAGAFTGTGSVLIGSSANITVDSNTVVGNSAGSAILTSGGSTNNLKVRGNNIGVKADGTTSSTFGNFNAGIWLNANATTVLIDNNVVCYNGRESSNLAHNSGIYVYAYAGGTALTISGVTISNNFVGVTRTYTKAGNDFAGIYLEGTNGTISSVTVSGNVIGDNGNDATQKSSGIATLNITSGNTQINGNYIGMTPTGGDIGNYHNGIEIFNTSGVTVNANYIGYNKALRNYGNTGINDSYYGGGIVFTSGTTGFNANSTVTNNHIGIAPNGNAAPQVTTAGKAYNNGIVVERVNNVVIGGAGAGNVITNMDYDAIMVIRSADYTKISQNSLYCNGNKAIDLNLSSGFTFTPGNSSYAAPVITSISSNKVSGTSPSGATIEIFYDADGVCARACSDTKLRQGKTYIATVTATGTTWTYTLPTGTFVNSNLTATATGNCSSGNCETSEFSTCNLTCASTIDNTGPTTVCAGTAATFTTTDATGPYTWVVSGGTINSGQGTTSISVTFTTSGSQTVKLTSGTCTQATYNVTVNAKPTITISGNASFCSGSSATLTASGGSSYTWSTGATGASITVSTGGTYTVTGTDANGCTNTASQTETINAKPTITISGNSSFCSGSSVTLTASGGSTYTWSTGATGASITVSTGGAYSVTGTDGNGCTNTASQTETVNPKPTITISGNSSFCSGSSATLTASGGSTYTWSTGATGASITVSTGGAYSVTGTDGNGCTNTASQTETVNPKPTITISGNSSFCSGSSATLTASGGSTYTWSTGATGASITVSTGGAYTVTGTDGNGCTNTASQTETVNAKPTITINASGPTTFCSGGNVNLTASGANSYSWSTGAAVAGITVSSTGTYTVTGTDANGCSNTQMQSVTVNSNPTILVNASGPTTFCSGGSVDLTASGASSYTWSTGSTNSLITVNSSGTYTVTGTDANGCSNTANQTVTVNPAPGTTSISGPTQFCPTGQTGMVYTATGGSVSSTYAWTVPSGATITSTPVTANSITVSFASGSLGGSVTVEETTSAGCAQTSALSINVTPGSKIASISGTPDSTVCLGQTVNLSANSSGAGYTFRWFKDNVFINETSADISVSPTPDGVYIYAVEVSNGSCKDTARIHVTINPNPGKPDLTGNTTSVCEATSGLPFSVASNSGSSYLWTATANPSSGATIASGQGTAAVTMDVGSGLTPQKIKLVVVETNTYNCSTPSDTFNITVNPRPLSAGISGPSSVCEASTGLQYSVTASNSSVTYNWKVPTGTSISSATSDSSSINVDFPVAVSSGYVKLYQTSSASCSVLKPDSILVTVNTRPTTGGISGLDKLCAGTSGVAYSVPDPGAGISTSWTITTGGTFSSANGSKDITASFTSGVDTVYITATNTVNSSGCSDLTPSLWKVKLNANPNTPLLSGADSICSGNLANKYNVISPDNKAHYTWTLPSGSSFDATAVQDSSAIFINFDAGFTSGTLTVVEVDSNNCSSSTPATWDIARFNVVGSSSIIRNGDREICSGGIQLTQKQNLQNGFSVHWSVVPGKGSATFYNSAHDTTTAWGFAADTNLLVLSISDECLNTVTDTVMVKVGATQLNVKATSPVDTVCLGATAQIQIEVNGSTATPFTYNWISSDGSFNTITKENPVTINLITGGWMTYKVDVYDINGCSTDTVLVDSLYGVAPQTLKIPNLITPNGDHMNDCWKITDINTTVDILPGSLLEIYNRWGDRVYQNNHYKNGDFCGSVLSDGIYFYYLKPVCGMRSEEKGWLQILSNTESSNK